MPYVSSSHSRNNGTSDTFNLPVTFTYKLSDIDTLSLRTQDYMGRNKAVSTGDYRSPTLNYDDMSLYSSVWRGSALNLIYDRNDDKTGAHFTLDVGHSDDGNNVASDEVETYTGGPSAIYGNRVRQTSPGDDIKVDYERRFDANRVLTAGFEWSRNGDILDRGYYDRGVVAGPNSDGFHRLFDGEVTVTSVYTTYQMPLGTWTILPGLRAEQERHTAHSITLAGDLSASGGTTKLYPSLHLSHSLGKIGKLKLSYSRRVQRPYIENYDPGITYQSRTSISIGNPGLKPTDIDSYEAEYSYGKGSSNYTAALYYRAASNLQAGQITVRSDGIIVYQTVNAGESHSGGAEMTFKAPLSAHWKYSLSTNLYDQQTPLFSGGSREDFNYAINGQVQYDAPAAKGKGGDQVQIVFNLSGRQYNPQGYYGGSGSLGVIWQHPLTPKVSMTVTASNLIQTKETVFVTRTPGVQARSINGQNNQALMVALAYKFGAKKK